ncbi:hypothetical protein FWH13_01530 [Candidatus Saccharibacteria bacterium]|nr:hypothetical protein [Candidatus Saccharibacteria bacterium]
MALTVEELQVLITAQTADFKKQMAAVNSTVTGFQKQVERSSGSTSQFTAGLKTLGKAALAILAFKQVVGFLRQANTEYGAAISNQIRLAQAMRLFGDSEADFKAVIAQTEQMQRVGVISAQSLQMAAQELRTYVSDVGSLQKVLPLVADMTAQQYGFGASAENAYNMALQVGKALNGTFDGLRRNGYAFSDADIALFNYGSEQERVARLSEIITENIGGMNEALGNTDYGRQMRLANSISDLRQQIGALTAGISNMFVPVISQFVNWIAKGISYVRAFLSLLGVQFGNTVAGANALAASVDGVGTAATRAGNRVRRSLAGFDEMNVLTEQAAGNLDGIGSSGFGIDAPPDLLDWGVDLFPEVELPKKFVAAIEAVKNGTRWWVTNVIDFWRQVGRRQSMQNLRESVLGLGDTFRRFADSFREFWDSPAFSVFREAVWIGISSHVKRMADLVAVAWRVIIDSIGNVADMLGVIMRLISGDFAGAWEHVRSIVGRTTGFWGDSIKLAGNIMKENALEAVRWFSNIGDGARETWLGIVSGASWLRDRSKESFVSIRDNALSAGSNIGGFFSGVWSGLADGLGNTSSRMVGIFGNIQSSISGLFSRAWGAVQDGANGALSWIGDSFKRIINSVIGGIEWVLGQPIRQLNRAIETINRIPGVSVGRIAEISLSRLAKGGIVSAPTRALIGEAGREAVLPLDTNTGWMDELAAKISSSGGGQQPVHVVVQIGEDTLIDKVVEGINHASFMQNRSVLAV